MTILLNAPCGGNCSCNPASKGLFFGGTFTTVNGTTRRSAAAWDPTSDTLQNWNPDITSGAPIQIYAMREYNGIMYLGGVFDNLGTTARANLAAINKQGSGAVQTLSVTFGGNRTVRDLVIVNDIIYFVGDFTSINGSTRNYAAAVDLDGNLQSWNPNLNNGGDSIDYYNGIFYIGGAFTTANGGTTRNHACAFDVSGSLQSWDPNTNKTEIMAVRQSGGLIYLGGDFTTVSGGASTRNGICAFDPSGVLQSFNPSVTGGAVPEVLCINFLGSLIYIGGAFTTVGGTARASIAAVDSTGALQAWNPGGAITDVECLAMDTTNSIIYVGGRLGTLGGASRVRLGAVDTSAVATAFNPAPNNVVTSMAWSP